MTVPHNREQCVEVGFSLRGGYGFVRKDGEGTPGCNDELKCPQGELKLAGGAGLLQVEWPTISI